MEQDVLARLKPLADEGRIECTAFFRICALMGVSFAAAMALASSVPAFAAPLRELPAPPSGYADLIGADALAAVNEISAKAGGSDQPDPFNDNYFVKSSGEPFHKFDKAPD